MNKKTKSPVARNKLPNMDLLTEIRNLILSARKAVVRNVDAIQVFTNFEIGRRIMRFEQKGKTRANYGEKILEKTSAKLTKEFGKGFSLSNLKLMRQFYVIYTNQIGQTLSGQLSVGATMSAALLSWSHYVFLMGINDAQERSFYEIEARQQNWSLRELERQFNSGLYERLALSRDKKGLLQLSRQGQVVAKPKDILKEPYVLEFLGLDEKAKYTESDLESAIIDKIEQFLLELGKGFLFEARQKRFTLDEDHFYVDLVFYNRLLKCYVLIDLKIGKLTHQDLGQMQMYVNYFDRHVKTREESSTVGIILCRKKKEALVEITLPKDANIHAKEYRLYLPTKTELKQRLIEWSRESEKAGAKE